MISDIDLILWNKQVIIIKQKENSAFQYIMRGTKHNYFYMKITNNKYKICIRYSTIETKEAAPIGYNRFLSPHEYSGESWGV